MRLPGPVRDVLVLAVLVVPQLVVVVPGTAADPPTAITPASPVVLATVCVFESLPVLVRRRAPWAALGAALLATPAVLAAGAAVPGLTLAVLAATVAARTDLDAARTAGGLLATVGVVAGAAVAVQGPLIAPVAAVALASGAGMAFRVVRDGRARTRALRETATTAAVLEADRRRVGGELHAAVRSRLVEVVDAADAPSTGDRDATLATITSGTRAALGALREMLVLLRDPAAPLGPSEASEAASERARPGPADLALLAATLVAVALGAALAPGLPAGPAALLVMPSSVGGTAVLGAQLLPIAFRRGFPAAAVIVASAGVAATALVPGSGGLLVGVMTWGALVVGAAVRCPPRRAVPALGATLAMTLPATALVDQADRRASVAATVALGAVLSAALIAGGLVRRARHRRDDAARAACTEAVRRAQRLRIARDLHDVVAHHVSGMAVQAGSARALAASRPDLVDDALAHVRDAGHRTLAALPALLTALDGEDRDGCGDVLDDTDVRRLAGPLIGAGAPLTVRVTGAAPPAGDALATQARHVVREALTNVLRHAGASPTLVVIDHTPSSIDLRVVDEGPRAGGPAVGVGGGHGLAGMRERVALLGGDVDAGPAGPGWRVRARLPRP